MFYIKPPNGHIPLYIMEKCLFTRLEYLEYLYNNKTDEFNGDFQYLLENSTYDRVGHFLLRLIAATSTSLWTYWIPKEILLLEYRVDNILSRQIHSLFKSIIEQLDTSEDKQSDINMSIHKVCLFYLQPIILQHIMSNQHDENCCAFQCEVRFELVPKLVEHREVFVKGGYATVYCSQWKKLLVALFKAYINQELDSKILHALYVISNDERIKDLRQKVQFLTSQSKPAFGKINRENIDVEVKKFPICMQHLYGILKERHRLSHYARLHYSLFLKDSGMKLNDAIEYWKEEYSKPHACTSVCTHNWQTNEKKFIYSIKHLYGLEGSHKNYKSPSCTTMCAQVPGSKYEGGCPFKNFGTNMLTALLNTSLTEDETHAFLEDIPLQRPETLCARYFKLVHKNNNDNIKVTSPSQYYAMATNSHYL